MSYPSHSVVNKESPSLVTKSFSSANGGTLCVLLPCDPSSLPRKDVRVIETLLYTAIENETHYFGDWKCEAGPNDRSHMVSWLKKATQLLADSKIQTLPTQNIGGLDDVQKGFTMMDEGKVRGQKLVFVV